MTHWRASIAELLTAIAAAIVIPFYLGFVHFGVPHLLLYFGGAGTAMAAGEWIESPAEARAGITAFAYECLVWTTVVLIIGSLVYLFALIF
jgi:hypothetical protein